MPEKLKMVRFNMNIPDTLRDEIRALAVSDGRDMTSLMRLSLGLIDVALRAKREGKKVCVLDPHTNEFSEIILE